jgi:hypothetical protein
MTLTMLERFLRLQVRMLLEGLSFLPLVQKETPQIQRNLCQQWQQ